MDNKQINIELKKRLIELLKQTPDGMKSVSIRILLEKNDTSQYLYDILNDFSAIVEQYNFALQAQVIAEEIGFEY